jgi:hypothetical protein
MMREIVRFNIYLIAGLLLVSICGCSSPFHREKKIAATITLHLEQDEDGISDIGPVTVGRSAPMVVSVDKSPFLDSSDLDAATVVDEEGGLFSIRLKFNWRGTSLLDAETSANPGKRIVIHASFGQKRWLAAPMIHQRIANGVLTFTPDCTREEADKLVEGLNNIAKEMKKEEQKEMNF